VRVAPEQISAVVLAGGFGTRIQHLLEDLPKPMAAANGKPFVEWVVRYLAKEGVRRVILSTHYRAEVFERHFAAQPVAGVAVQCAREDKPLGTAGGFLNATRAAAEVPAAWLVLNGDSLALTSLAGMLAELDDPQVGGAILGVPMPDASRYGTVVANARGALAGFQEKRPGAGVINAGVYLLRTSLLEQFPARVPLSFETDVFPALSAGPSVLKVCAAPAPFLDIGTPQSLPQADAFVRQHADRFA
jgi:NDP-sugar pyrophosphorylase family protein